MPFWLWMLVKIRFRHDSMCISVLSQWIGTWEERNIGYGNLARGLPIICRNVTVYLCEISCSYTTWEYVKTFFWLGSYSFAEYLKLPAVKRQTRTSILLHFWKPCIDCIDKTQHACSHWASFLELHTFLVYKKTIHCILKSFQNKFIFQDFYKSFIKYE